MTQASSAAPVLFAYDGTDLAGHAIETAAAQLVTPREAVVTVVWQPADVGFTPADGEHFDADESNAVRAAAEHTAARGAALATAAGFTARPLAVQDSPLCDGILAAADEVGASLIVVGARHHGALASRLLGHVAPSLLSRTSVAVLVVHEGA